MPSGDAVNGRYWKKTSAQAEPSGETPSTSAGSKQHFNLRHVSARDIAPPKSIWKNPLLLELPHKLAPKPERIIEAKTMGGGTKYEWETICMLHRCLALLQCHCQSCRLEVMRSYGKKCFSLWLQLGCAGSQTGPKHGGHSGNSGTLVAHMVSTSQPEHTSNKGQCNPGLTASTEQQAV
jgi:hypothetical protein